MDESAPSRIASLRVGCAWITFARSSMLAPMPMAIAASPIRSVALLPRIWTPRILSYSSSTTNFTTPSPLFMISALPLAFRGNFPILYLYPIWAAFASVSPTPANSGLV